VPPAKRFASEQTPNPEAHEDERKNESGCRPGIHELASNGELERPHDGARLARNRRPFTGASNYCEMPFCRNQR
jgi:hypothetical protein